MGNQRQSKVNLIDEPDITQEADKYAFKGSERRIIDTDFTVIKGEGHALLGYKSAKDLGILQINQVNQDIYRNYE